MLENILYYFFPVLFVTFFLPGILFSLLILNKKTVDFSLFSIYVIVLGFFSQAILIMTFSLTKWTTIPIFNHFLSFSVLLSTLMFIYLFLRRKNIILPTVKIGSYDIVVLLITIVIILLLLNNFSHLNNAYFNPGTDQYHWLSYGEQFLHDPWLFLSKFFKNYLNRNFFFIFLSPYISFLPKNLDIYQGFIAFWVVLHYIFITLGISRLAFSYLSTPPLGALVPLILFSLHWFNYYLISTGIVPQNTGLFLFIVGFLIIKENIREWFVWIFLFLFYLIHIPTLAMFVLVVGSAKIFDVGYKLLFNKLIFHKFKNSKWHLFEKLFFIPSVVVMIMYSLYLLNLIPYYNLENISYYEDYAKNYTLLSQPYTEKYHNNIFGLAVIGLITMFILNFNNSMPLVFGMILPWVFLKTPIVAYHAFYASWQAFRYYLILYPSLCILALYPILIVYRLMEKWLSLNLAKTFIFLVIIFLLPFIGNQVWKQQGYIFLDMIQGRDGGNFNVNKRNEILNLFHVKDLIKNKNLDPVVLLSYTIDKPYIDFVFAPRKTLILEEDVCNELSCKLSNGYNLFEIKHILALYNKKNNSSKTIDFEALKRKFKYFDEWNDYILLQ